jgi:hypothetical protein
MNAPALLLALLLCIGPGYRGTAHADDLQDVCRFVEVTLKSIKGARVSRATAAFQFHDLTYKGCVVSLKGDSTKVKGDRGLEQMFYPFEGTPRYQQGWRADEEFDGADGTAFRFYNGKAFCLVTGSWDGGDDSDPAYKPSPLFEYKVSCARG